jgi:hypothetical protein
MSKILTNRCIVLNERINTSDVLRIIKERFSSVLDIEYMDTTSTAGDWSGIIVQKIGKTKCVAIIFSIENIFWRDGFNVYTDDVYYELPLKYTLEDLQKVYADKIGWY